MAEPALLDDPIPDPDEPLDDPLELVEQPLVVEIYDPLGNLVASSPPTPGPALAATVPFAPGIYMVTIRNQGTREVTYDSYRIIRELWLP